MARLSKHGTELLRVAKETDITDPNENITWARSTRAYMSDGTVLVKRDVRFKPDQFDRVGKMHTWGWKVFGHVKADRTPQQAVANITAKIRNGESKWEIVNGQPAPVILDVKDVMAAVENDDNTGFCQACGAEAYNVEPDARGYTCESCGQPEVYGAQELLMTMA